MIMWPALVGPAALSSMLVWSCPLAHAALLGRGWAVFVLVGRQQRRTPKAEEARTAHGERGLGLGWGLGVWGFGGGWVGGWGSGTVPLAHLLASAQPHT